MRARKLSLIPLLVFLALLPACGGDDEGGGAGAAERPVEDQPQRIVALDFPSADAALALGVKPVGIVEVTYVEGGIQEWTKAALGDAKPTLINTDQGFPIEKIAALEPDLILATNTYPLVDESYDELSAIAPVVKHVDAPGVDTWQQGMRQVSKALGREQEGEIRIKDVETNILQAKAEHPEFADKSVAFFNYVAGDGLYAISDDDDFSIKFLTELGFSGVAPSIAKLKGVDGRAEVGPEQYDLLDAGVVIGTSPDPAALAKLEKDTLFARVPAVEHGRYLGLGIGPATAMAFPSVLSVQYAIETLVPQLSDAVR